MSASTYNGVTLPSPPFVQVEGLPNLRDIGGYPVSKLSPNHSVRRGLVFRGGAPANIDEDGLKTIKSLGITHVYDLRSNTEIEKAEKAGRAGVVLLDGSERVFAPVFTDVDYSPQNLATRFANYQSGTPEGFAAAYTDILEHAPPSYTQILRHIAERPSSPLLLHCTAGKDRTGVFCALILSLCGVDDETVAHEYSLTESGLAHWREEVAEGLMKSHSLPFDKSGALNMLSARFESMMATLEIIRERFGGPEGYLLDRCELSNEELSKIRSNMVIEEPPIHRL